MPKHMTRRKALAAGTSAVGIIAAAGCSPHEQTAISEESSPPPFLTPWSPPENVERDLTPGNTPVRLASWSSTTTLDYKKDVSPTELVKRIRDAGYTSGNAYTGMNAPRNPWLECPDSEISELKAAMEKYDVTFFDMHSVGNNLHPDTSTREKSLKYIAECCEAAERVGCPMVTSHAGNTSPVSAISPHKDNWTWDSWKLAVKGTRQILKDTAGMNVELGIEAVNMTCMNNPRAHARFIEDVGDPRCKVLLDPINMISLRNYFRTTELINECFDLLGENILAAHAKDTLILDKMLAYITELAAGKGELDYEQYLVRLSKLNTPRTLLIEHIPDEQYAEAKKFIEDTAAKVGVAIYS
jgi:sugar phosphate isomerase/epimerase